MTERALWDRCRKYLCFVEPVGFTVDVSRMNFPDGFIDRMSGPLERAFDAMTALEKGAIANPDENRMVGHYWLRAPALAPDPAIRGAIETTLASIESFAGDVHSARVRPERKPAFSNLLVIGIGGSALGPQFVSDALGGTTDRMRAHFIDNTDPDGIDRVFDRIGKQIDETLTLVISKSGGTKETRNGMLEAASIYAAAGLRFGRHAAAVTGEGSLLDRHAVSEGFLARFPMWDWVGGRTSELSAVGLLPAALQGIGIREMLEGARLMDEATRTRRVAKNPAALLALMWHHAGGGRGAKDMVVLPYRDRFVLFSKYLQQLVMESLGKERDLQGRVVNQGIAVYGNKGSTDQHAYVQQLREGVNNFFATFIAVLEERGRASIEVEPGITSGDFLAGFLLGTRRALFENGRESITITVPDSGPRTVGALIALFERAVGLYASLAGINAYHQPGVEAGKKAAEAVIGLQRKVLAELASGAGRARTAEELAAAIGAPDETETVWAILTRLAANPARGISRAEGPTPFDAKFAAAPRPATS